MTANQAMFPLATMCKSFGVSRAGYYAWLRREPSARCRADVELSVRIKAIHKARTIPMHSRVHAALVGLWQSRGRPGEGHVFLNRLGRPYSDTRQYRLPGGNPLRKAHETASRRAGIQDFRIHDWRHHWVSWCVMEGIDLETIKRMGGWKSLRMLERHVAVSTEHMDAAISRLT